MKLIILTTFIILGLTLACSADTNDRFLRADGGDFNQCNGKFDAPKNSSHNCAWNNVSLILESSPSGTNNIFITKGKLKLSIQPVGGRSRY